MSDVSMNPDMFLAAGFIVLAVSLVVGCAIKTRSFRFGVLGVIWLVVTGGLAAGGILSDFAAFPPRIFLLFLPVLAFTVYMTVSNRGQAMVGLSVPFLIGFQAFRIPVEILIHLAVEEGVAPPQMSWSGMNFDIITGISALMLFPFAKRLPQIALLVWNSIGLGLLLWVVGVAVLSFPTPFQKLEPDNTWIAGFPFIWLPTVAVPVALAGHLVLFRKLMTAPGIER